MKILVLGDIHGRTTWKHIIDKESPDKVVFLGDYVSTYYDILERDQVDNLVEILKYKESHSSGVVLLRGNHDMEALGYEWAACFPVFRSKFLFWEKNAKLRDRFLKDTQWVFRENNILFSHAGVSQTWFDILKEKYSTTVKDIVDINLLEPSKDFGFTTGVDNPSDSFGNSIYQPCTCIRLDALIRSAVPGTHVVGHSTTMEVFHLVDKIPEEEKNSPSIKNLDIWCCDALGNGSYLSIEDQTFHVKNILDK